MQLSFDAHPLPSWIHTHPKGTLMRLRVRPGAKQFRLGPTVGEDRLGLGIQARAQEGQANLAIIEQLSKCLGIAQRRVEIHSGHKSKNKTLIIHDLSPQECWEKFEALLTQ